GLALWTRFLGALSGRGAASHRGTGATSSVEAGAHARPVRLPTGVAGLLRGGSRRAGVVLTAATAPAVRAPAGVRAAGRRQRRHLHTARALHLEHRKARRISRSVGRPFRLLGLALL